MPSTLQKMLRLGVLLPLLCLTGMVSPISVRANEPAPTSQPGEIYRAFHAKPQQINTTQQPSHLENAPRFSKPNHQTAPLAALLNDVPTRESTAREPARLFEDENYFANGRPIADARTAQQAGSQSTNQLRNQTSNNRPVNRIATTGNSRVNPVNHLRPTQDIQPTEKPARFASDRSPASVPAYGQAAQQIPEPTPNQFSPQEPKTAPIPLPQSSPPTIALAPKGKAGEKGETSSGIFTMLMTMGGALLLVIGLFLVFAWMMKRTSTRTGGLLPQGVVEVLGHQTVAGRQQVHLLRIGKRLLLVSIMPDSMETLTEITDPVEVDRIAGICRQSGSGSSTGAFQAVMRQFGQDSNQPQEPIPTVDELRQRIGS